MSDDIYLKKAQEFFETNKDNLYIFSVESLYTVENPDIVQISFQRMLNENISKEDFIFAENKIIAFLEYLYIKSDKLNCYVATHLNEKPLNKHKNIKKKRESEIFTAYVIDDIYKDKCVAVKNINSLRGFVLIGTRYRTIYLYYENPDLDIVIDSCQSFYVKFKDINIANKFITVASKLGIKADRLNLY